MVTTTKPLLEEDCDICLEFLFVLSISVEYS